MWPDGLNTEIQKLELYGKMFLLQKELIELIGKEKFGQCGVQLMFLKNFEYNLKKLQGD